jgi:hypothetical protein
MRIQYHLFSLLLFFAYSTSMNAQHDHDKHDHDLHKNEIGGALGAVFNLNEQHMASGFHIHYMRMFGGKLHNFGVAPGLEFFVGEDKHYTLHVLVIYRPTHGFWLGAGPGVTYFDHHEEIGFSGHIETGYEFDAGSIHFGPVIEYTWAKEDQHIMLGIHLGVPF